MTTAMHDVPKLRRAVRIVDAVREALRDAILSGAVAPGAQLSVPELARRLDVSRSPVREAVLQLVADGLAVEQPRRGVVVATVGLDDLLQIHEIREFVEALAARLCAERIDAAGLLELRRVLDRQHACVEADDAAGYFDTNVRFHALIGSAAGNDRLRDFLKILGGQMCVGLKRASSNPQQRRQGLAEHEQILAAIGSYDPDRAETLMRHHIGQTKARLAAAKNTALHDHVPAL